MDLGMKISSYRDLDVYHMAMDAAMEIFTLTSGFPREEKYSLVDQIRRSSRSVCANIAEAWRRRRYKAAFVNKMNEAETEAEETRVWLEFSLRCKYIDEDIFKDLDGEYGNIIGKIVRMIMTPEKWIIKR
jgi:four helix bundle protein